MSEPGGKQSIVKTSARPSDVATSERHEDWSEIEALLSAPNAALEAAAATVAVYTAPARRLSLGLAAVVVLGGVAALGLAQMRGCRGDACGSPASERAMTATQAETPVRVVAIDAVPASPVLAEGRSEAEPTPVRHGPQAATRPRRSRPTPSTVDAPPVTTQGPRSSRAKPPVRRPAAIAAADHAPRPLLARARPPAMSVPLPTPRTWARAQPRLRLVWISPTRYVLVETN